jgi:hypothetical protein
MKKIMLAVAVAVAALSVRASLDGYFMLSLFSQGQLPSPAYSIYGGRLSLIYGDCHELHGLDLGMAGQTRESLYGLQVNGLWSGVGADLYGAQFALANTIDRYAYGFQSGAFNLSSDAYGCQLSAINLSDDVNGAQLGLFNVSKDIYGCQLGAVNVAKDVYGCQISAVNVAKTVCGCQLGAVNVARKLYGCQIGVVNIETSANNPAWIVLNIGW